MPELLIDFITSVLGYAPGPTRERIGFPPFPPENLGNSFAHLAELAAEIETIARLGG